MKRSSLCTLLGTLGPIAFAIGCGEDKPADTATTEVSDSAPTDTNDTGESDTDTDSGNNTGVDTGSGDTGSSDTGTDTAFDTGNGDTGDTDTVDTGSTTGPGANAVPDFLLADINPNSSTLGQNISPRDYLQQISGWYFIKST